MLKHLFCKTYGWTLDYVESLTYKQVIFLQDCMKKEIEIQERESKKARSNMGRKKW